MTVTGRTSTFLQRVLKSTVHGSLGKGMSRTNADGPGIDTVSVVRPLLFLDFQMNYPCWFSACFVDIKGLEAKPSSKIAPDRTAAMLNIPEKYRSCKVLLKEGKFRPTRLWRWSTHNRSRAPYPNVKDFLSYIWIRRSFDILQYSMTFLSPVSDYERRVAVT